MPVTSRLMVAAAFALLALLVALYGLAAAGQFPHQQRLERFRGRIGAGVLWSTMLVTAIATASALIAVVPAAPWADLIVGACLALVFAPLVLQSLPDTFVDGRRGLAALAACSAFAALVLVLGIPA